MPCVTLALRSQTLLKLCILTLASPEDGRLAVGGQAKFTDKGQFGGGCGGGGGGRQKVGERQRERAGAKEGEKSKTRVRDLSPRL